ncbi:MAG: nicotinate-nucleotide--dimethylbenzimidazole phosphoribosyltransferase [Alphaproteobacteria bacterium]|nr:nicotinate-nucleotide--dimethylbenzimidazole phosphoribosyltransferase [Alphaproteobacteria bacterium]
MTSAPQPAQPQAAFTLDDIRRLVMQDFPPLSAQVPPAGAATLGTFAPLRQWLADTQGKTQPALRHPRIALFLSRHGIGGELQQDLAQLPAALAKPAHPLSAIAADINADLQVYELDIDTASGDPAQGAALSEAEAMQALAYGMMAVQPGIDCAVIALPNPAAALAAQNLRAALDGKQDALAALLQFGGFDIAAALGAAIAARLAKAPVLLDDSAEIIGDLLQAFTPAAALHCRTARDVIAADMKPTAGLRAALALALLKSLCKAT